MKAIFLFVTSIFLLSGCNLFDKYPSFSKTNTGIYYKLQKIGEDVNPPEVSDYVTVSIDYLTVSDSMFFSGVRTFQLTEPDFKGAIDECFLMLSEGDSASFIIDANDFFTKTLQTKLPVFISSNDPLKIEIRMDEIRSEKQYTQDKAEFLKWIEDFGEYEKMILARFIKEEEIDVEATTSGLIHMTTHVGTGKPVEPGDLVTVNYEGKFLNGKFFDSTADRNQPFEFVYGTELQVIPGIEEAIGKMREGEKAIVILPSNIAWGDKGSSTGIIPPFTTVIYEIELVQSISRNIYQK